MHYFIPGSEKQILNENKASVMTTTNDGALPTPLLKKILECNNSSKRKGIHAETNVQSLPHQIRNIVKELPNLNFMRSNVLMFPIRDDCITANDNP